MAFTDFLFDHWWQYELSVIHRVLLLFSTQSQFWSKPRAISIRSLGQKDMNTSYILVRVDRHHFDGQHTLLLTPKHESPGIYQYRSHLTRDTNKHYNFLFTNVIHRQQQRRDL